MSGSRAHSLISEKTRSDLGASRHQIHLYDHFHIPGQIPFCSLPLPSPVIPPPLGHRARYSAGGMKTHTVNRGEEDITRRRITFSKIQRVQREILLSSVHPQPLSFTPSVYNTALAPLDTQIHLQGVCVLASCRAVKRLNSNVFISEHCGLSFIAPYLEQKLYTHTHVYIKNSIITVGLKSVSMPTVTFEAVAIHGITVSACECV